MFTNKKQQGRSMIEMLGVLAIVGILSAGGIAGYSMAIQNHKTNVLIDKIQLMIQQARALFPDGTYEGLSAANLKNAGFINDYNNPFGGTIVINGYIGSFQIRTDYNIPADACVKLLMAEWGEFFRRIELDGSTYQFKPDNGTYPISRATAISACKGGNKQVRLFFKH